MDSLSTGIDSLDWLMRGGLLQGGLHLVTGDPASGKTILAHQIAAESVTDGRVLYLTALVESHTTLREQASNFDFFDPERVGDRLYYSSIQPAFAKAGFDAVQTQLLSLVREHDPVLMILDGLHALRMASGDRAEYHRFLNGLQAMATSTGVSVLMVSNRSSPDEDDAMYTVADAILVLATQEDGPARRRRLEVRKLRTRDHSTGWHAFEITGRGIEVYPRIEALVAERYPHVQHVPPEGLQAFGVGTLDEMLGGGTSAGSATLLVGTSGVGKTALALSWLRAGLEAGETAVFLGFHETPDRLLEKAESLGMGLRSAAEDDRLRALWHSTAELPADRLAHRLIRHVEELEATRVVIDGMDDLTRVMAPAGREVSFISGLLDLLRARGVGVVLTAELADMLNLDLSTPLEGVSTAVDNLLLLRYADRQTALRRLLSVIKVRAHEADTDTREFIIRPSGIRVDGPAEKEDG